MPERHDLIQFGYDYYLMNQRGQSERLNTMKPEFIGIRNILPFKGFLPS